MVKRKSISQLKWWNYAMLVAAGIVNAAGVVLFLMPSGILDGGFSGLSILLSRITGLYVGIFIVAINLPFFIFGVKKLGWSLIVCSLIAIFTYAVCTFLFITVFKLDQAVFELTDKDMFLCAIFGGLISGVGSGLTIRLGGAMDGVEVLAVLFSKKLGLTVGQFVMIFNIVIYAAACIVFRDLRIGLYSIVAYAIGLRAVDFVVEGFDKGKACIIVTEKGEKLAELLSTELGRGITILNSKGYYSKENKTMLYCVVNRFEIGRLKQMVASIDGTAFMTISDISEVVGRTDVSFSNNIKKSKRKEPPKSV